MSVALPLQTLGAGTQRYRLELLLRPSLGAVGVALDLTWLLRVLRADPWWFIRRNHQDPSLHGTLVIGGDADPDLLKLANIWRRGSSRAARSTMLLVDLLLQPVAAEGVSHTLVIGARYVERNAVGTRLGLEVTI
jgi:hypothetical protein